MDVVVVPCLCSLYTSVLVVGVCMGTVYLVMGMLVVGWFVLNIIGSEQTEGHVYEVDSFDEVYDDLVVNEKTDNTFVYLTTGISISFLGIVSSFMLVVGVL